MDDFFEEFGRQGGWKHLLVGISLVLLIMIIISIVFGTTIVLGNTFLSWLVWFVVGIISGWVSIYIVERWWS